MDYALIIASVVSLHAAVIMLAVCFAAGGGMERNNTVGIRIWSTMSSQRAWTAGHRAAVPWCWASVVISVVFLIVAVVLHRDEERLSSSLQHAVMWPAVGAVVLVLLVAGWACDRAAKRALVLEHLGEEHGGDDRS
ncbi:SdpI family protein [Nesterenkonia lacusekhoensis]|uniref:ABC-type sugar transport system permease subunit n=1 Tax=Nesterenkonia lacusekhoensis TaxID=150832 RepID=A0ABS4SZJ3_9MICC|nr:SdpI family protein [Nesterenkonia lacusekhoensis]MBP2317625.1 ABC-type sugar transport system permease subunit [Nesterenkonia lacusekhoensis]